MNVYFENTEENFYMFALSIFSQLWIWIHVTFTPMHASFSYILICFNCITSQSALLKINVDYVVMSQYQMM